MTISTVTIVGAGYMGGGIAQVLAIAGFDVTIADVSVENANASLERLQRVAGEKLWQRGGERIRSGQNLDQYWLAAKSNSYTPSAPGHL